MNSMSPSFRTGDLAIPEAITLPEHGRLRLGFRAYTLAGDRGAIEGILRQFGVQHLFLKPHPSRAGTRAYEVEFQPPSVEAATDAVQALTDIGEVFFLD